MAQLNEALIEEIRFKSDIVAVIGNYIPLIKKGRNYSAICPFHDDHSPSMSISVDKQIYKCFVCNEGGNVFRFVQEYEKIGFVEAVKKVAEICHIDVNIEVNNYNKEEVREEIEILYKILNEATSFCQYQLKTDQGVRVVAYLHERGIDDELINTFQLGYNPPNNALYKFLSSKGYKDEDIVRSGLVRLASSGLVDVFDERIMFPIHNTSFKPIAFSARDFQINKTLERPKYINSSQSELYTKAEVVYNLNRCKDIARKKQELIVVEGPIDVMALYRANYQNVVATMGTAFTKEQAQILKRSANMIIMCYDGDEAGQNANYKAGLILSDLKTSFKIIRNDLGLDPDEIIKQHSVNELKAMLEIPMNWIDFLFIYLPKRYNFANYDDKKAFAAALMNEINKLGDSFDQTNYISRLSLITSFSNDQLQKLIKNTDNNRLKNTKSVQTTRVKNLSKFEIAENTILVQMLYHKKASDLFEEKLGSLVSPSAKYLALFLVTYYRTHNFAQLSDLVTLIDESVIRDYLFEMADNDIYLKEYSETLLFDCFDIMIKNDYQKQIIEDLNAKASALQDPLAKAELYKEINQLKYKRKRD